MQDRVYASAYHSENRHRLCEAVDRVSPALFEQQQDCRDQRASVTDADPPHEVDNGETPGHWLRDAPDSNAFQEEPCDGDERHASKAACDTQCVEPTERSVRSEDEAGNLLRNRLESMPTGDHGILACDRIDHWIVQGVMV